MSLWERCAGLAERGFAVDVVTTNAGLPEGGTFAVNEASFAIEYCEGLAGSYVSPGWIHMLLAGLGQSDAYLVFGAFCWVLPLILLLGRFCGTPTIVSAGGMLSGAALAFKSRRKRMFLAVLKMTWENDRDAFHVTSDAEACDVRREFPGARLYRIPHGIDVPSDGALARPGRVVSDDYFLSLSRLHPIKQIDVIIDAFAVAAPDLPKGMRLVIAGEGRKEYAEELMARAVSAGVGERVMFVGPVAGDTKGALLRDANCVIAASRSENFGISIAEALAHGTPVIASKGTPWEALPERGCGLWIEVNASNVAESMRLMARCSGSQREEIQRRARQWMRVECARDRELDAFERAIAELTAK